MLYDICQLYNRNIQLNSDIWLESIGNSDYFEFIYVNMIKDINNLVASGNYMSSPINAFDSNDLTYSEANQENVYPNLLCTLKNPTSKVFLVVCKIKNPTLNKEFNFELLLNDTIVLSSSINSTTVVEFKKAVKFDNVNKIQLTSSTMKIDKTNFHVVDIILYGR